MAFLQEIDLAGSFAVEQILKTEYTWRGGQHAMGNIDSYNSRFFLGRQQYGSNMGKN
jgi:hypothetical protein